MKTTWILALSLFCAPAFAAPHAPITERTTPVRQRAMKMGYAKTARLINKDARLREQLGPGEYGSRSIGGMAYQMTQGYGDEEQRYEQQTVRREPTGEKTIFGKPKLREVVEYRINPTVLEQIKRDTAAHPDLAEAGAALVEAYSAPSSMPRAKQLGADLKQLLAPLKREMSTLVAQRGRLGQAEQALMDKLDARFVTNLPKLSAALETKAPEALAEYALDLVHKINAASTTKTVRKEEVARGESRGESSGSGYTKGPLGGDRGGWSSSSSSWSKFRADALILDGSDYTVVVKSAHSGASTLGDTSAVGIVDARQIAEMSVEVALITRALEKRAPELAAPFSGWLNHSRIEFKNEGGQSEHIELSRADSDVAQKLPRLGLVSARFASTLEKHAAKSLGDRLDMHPLLDE